MRQQPDQRRVVGEVGVDAPDGPALGPLGADGRGDVDGVPEAGPPRGRRVAVGEMGPSEDVCERAEVAARGGRQRPPVLPQPGAQAPPAGGIQVPHQSPDRFDLRAGEGLVGPGHAEDDQLESELFEPEHLVDDEGL